MPLAVPAPARRAHYYEPDDCFTRHIETRHRDETVVVRRGDDGFTRDRGYGADGRVFGIPMLSLLNLDHAMTELHRWATVSEAGVPVVFHTSNSGYQHFCGTHWSENPNNPSHRQSPLQWALCNTERPVVDTLIALTLHNLFGRHPQVRIVSIENGSNWLRPLFKTIDKAANLGRRGLRSVEPSRRSRARPWRVTCGCARSRRTTCTT